MKTLSNYSKILLGKNDGQNIYLSPPSWDYGWYWGFGYLGNNDCHYHIDGLNKNINLHDAIIEHFGNTLTVRPSDVWTLAELFKTFYDLKTVTSILKGSSGLTSNPCKNIILNIDEITRINNIVLPQVFEEIYKILIRNQNNEKLFKKLVSLNVEGNTQKVVDFMNENSIKTDDLKIIKGVTKHDFNIIHSLWWKQFHAKK